MEFHRLLVSDSFLSFSVNGLRSGACMLFQPYFVLLTPTNLLAMKMHSWLLWKYCQPSVSDPDKKSWDIMHHGIFLALTKQLPLKVPGKGCIKGNQVGE